MIEDTPGLIEAIRDRFAHVERCPFTGPRIFFENAGGALTLKSVAALSAEYAAIPDNQGRDNPASAALMAVIAEARDDMRAFFNAPDGEVFVGESGTELLFRLIGAACLGMGQGGRVLGSTLEHPASRSAAARWAEVAGQSHEMVAHDDATGTVTAEHYAAAVTPDTKIATIVHTSPVTGMGVDVAAVAAAIRAVAPDCLIIVDGIQHAAHGGVDVSAAGVDGYAISPYKVFSRHGYGVAWAGPRLAAMPHDNLAPVGGPEGAWELGTRDTGAYATFSEVVRYLDWLGAQVSEATDRRARLEAAAGAIKAHEQSLTDAMIQGTGNQPGLKDMPAVRIVGGAENPAREGLVSLWVEGLGSDAVVSGLNERGVRTHIRKNDHYSGNILGPLGQTDCVRVSLAHYNTTAEVAQFLSAMREITA
ncbi:MAG: aminotransferase class V-fold PLP-dependent enzyme [Pseudomonadota bacterium]